MNISNRRKFLTTSAAAGMLLAGCKPVDGQMTQQAGGAGANNAVAMPNMRSSHGMNTNGHASLRSGKFLENDFKVISSQLHGFTTGPQSASTSFHILVDPMCPYCAYTWEQSKTLWEQVQFFWYPVALMGDKSKMYGAMILGSNSPANTMNAHEAFIQKKATEQAVNPEFIQNGSTKIEHNRTVALNMDVDAVPLTFFEKRNGEILGHDLQLSSQQMMAIIMQG